MIRFWSGNHHYIVMRIAFVGKGGSGKSTLTAAYASYLRDTLREPIMAFDADVNVHLPHLLGFTMAPNDTHLSHPDVVRTLKTWLIGDNKIDDLDAFRKTTPPTTKSNLIYPSELQNTPLASIAQQNGSLSLFVVGTYQEDGIGASCYHNNLSILENTLSHTNDTKGYILVDMVAGVDSFAGTLHSQFDLTCIVLEPTKRSIEVYQHYKKLARSAAVDDTVKVIANKITDDTDRAYVMENIEPSDLLGFFTEDNHLRAIDKTGERISVKELTPTNQSLLESLHGTLENLPDRRQQRLHKLWELHRTYVSQAFVAERFGDLTSQIDTSFSYRQEMT
jgi:CO dehydrogenase maturation factor